MLNRDPSDTSIPRVSAALDDLRQRLGPAAHGGRYLTSGEAIALMDELVDLADAALQLEREVGALRWNYQGRVDGTSCDVDEGGNVVRLHVGRSSTGGRDAAS